MSGPNSVVHSHGDYDPCNPEDVVTFGTFHISETIEYIVGSSNQDIRREDEYKTRIWNGNTTLLWPLLLCVLYYLIPPAEAASPEELNDSVNAGLIVSTCAALAIKIYERRPKKTRRQSKRKSQQSGEY